MNIYINWGDIIMENNNIIVGNNNIIMENNIPIVGNNNIIVENNIPIMGNNYINMKYKIICDDGKISILKTSHKNISIIPDVVQTDFEIKCDIPIKQVERAITIMIGEVNYTDDDFHNLDNYTCLYNELNLYCYDKIQSIKLFYEERQKRILELARIKYLVKKNKCNNSSFNNFNSNLGELELFKTISQFV